MLPHEIFASSQVTAHGLIWVDWVGKSASKENGEITSTVKQEILKQIMG